MLAWQFEGFGGISVELRGAFSGQFSSLRVVAVDGGIVEDLGLLTTLVSTKHFVAGPCHRG